MSNGMLFGPSRTQTRTTLQKFSRFQIRSKSIKKFIIPPSFQSHLKANHNRRSLRDVSISGSKVGGSLDQQSFEGVKYIEDDGRISSLDNAVERQLNKVANQEFGMDMEPTIEQFCGRPHHPEIAWFMKGYVSRDLMAADPGPLRLLWKALDNFLPQDPLNDIDIITPRGQLHHQTYSLAGAHDHGSAHPGTSTNRMNLGWHLIMFNQPIHGQRLLFDGTDYRFIPGPPAIWKYRLWAGGSINIHRMFGESLPGQGLVHQIESPIGLRIVGANQTPEKLFVTVRKRFYKVEGSMFRDYYNLQGLLRFLKADPVPDGGTAPRKAGPVLEETYTLCFLRDPPNLANKGIATRVIPPPAQPKFSHTLTPDRHLLFCWSALTYNAHRIHLDQAFAQKEYGAQDLVVHGPLTLLLVLEWFHRQITTYAMERQLSRFHLRSIDYKVLAPMYVDETMRLCTKPTKFQTPGTLADSWEVWVEKDVGDGLKTMTFKGTIKLRTETGKFTDKGHMLISNSDRTTDPSIRSDGTPVDEFKSPFF